MSARIPLTGKASGQHMLVDAAWAAYFEDRNVHIGGHGYATFNPGGRYVLVHRWIAGCFKGDGMTVDHINRNVLDNRMDNLRVSPRRTINGANREFGPDLGVYREGHAWRAQAQLRGKHVHLGRFSTKSNALRAAREWRIENMPGFPGGKVAADV